MLLFTSCLMSFICIVLPVLISVAYLTLAERKIMGAMQQRTGPTVVGFWGLLQPLADGLKLFLKETVIPENANTFGFIFSPILSLFLSLLGWSLIPFTKDCWFVDLDLGVLLLLAISSLSVYGIIISGWASNSKYAFFGAIRSAAQMISYEISMGLTMFPILTCVGSLNLSKVIFFQISSFFIIPFLFLFLIFVISILAETNRAPFDLPEAESELVSGYNVEYAAMGFALFFLAEYTAMILMSALTAIFFLGGGIFFLPLTNFTFISSFSFSLKICMILFFYIWVRASFPRYRMDQLMRLCWKIFLPITLAFFLTILCVLFVWNGFC